MNKTIHALNFGGPADETFAPYKYDTPEGIYFLDRTFEAVRYDLARLPATVVLSLLGFSDDKLEACYRDRLDERSEKLLAYLQMDWAFPETGERVPINTAFVRDFLGLDVVYRTVVRRLRARKFSLPELATMIYFFNEHLIRIDDEETNS